MNRMFVVDKPIFRSSNSYMGYIKRKYNTKKVGFSGTLDPFATGCLIVATGKYTKLFQYLRKSPKVYRATLWLGAYSDSFDIENIKSIQDVAPIDETLVADALGALQGELRYLPPKYSAKMIDGKRAYDLARMGADVKLREITSTVYDIKLIHYTHPFVHFEVTVSEGTYVRSLGQMIAHRLGVQATLSSLRRISEGEFEYDDERAIDPFARLSIPSNRFLGDHNVLKLGQKLDVSDMETTNDGVYLVESGEFYTIVEIEQGVVRYRLNHIPKYQKEEF